MRVAFDYTSAIHQRAGVGRYTRSLAAELEPLLCDDEFILWYTSRSRAPLSLSSTGARFGGRSKRIPLSPRTSALIWQRMRLGIPIDRLIGSPDVLHSPDFVAPPAKAPVIVTIHDLSFLVVPEFAHPNLKRYLEASVPRTLRRAAHVIAVSDVTRQDIIERYNVQPERVSTIYNGVDGWFYAPDQAAVDRALEHFGLRRPYFVIVGTVEPRKNHLAVLHAFAKLYEHRKDVSLAIAGSPGWLSEPIIAEIEKAAMSMPVRYLRFVDDTWIPALYAGSVALVAPSWYEGFGLPVLEAMACGAAVITSDRGSLPEIAGDNAILVPPGDIEELAASMQRLLDDTTLRADLVQRGRAHAATFSWRAAAEAHVDLYRQVAANR
ncbi:MAG TPA: glycosyltransferase family 1 protein [Nitrolancea sp.]|nr:glycosyltransferase family 1 protein [Nitrolancea sp.]